jgi:hypothetical protein
MFSNSDLTLSCSPPTDMARKPKPLPLSYSRALIEREKLAVLQRTARRIHQLTGGTPTDSPTTEPRGKWIHYTKVLATSYWGHFFGTLHYYG